MKRCPTCNSIWVCWNWIHCDLSYSPAICGKEWGHECWDCGSCCDTDNKVKNGLPYWILKRLWPIFKK